MPSKKPKSEKPAQSPYALGEQAAAERRRQIEIYNAHSGDDGCPFKKGTSEEKEFDRGWKAYMKRTPW
jgi:hypothetical protein